MLKYSVAKPKQLWQHFAPESEAFVTCFFRCSFMDAAKLVSLCVSHRSVYGNTTQLAQQRPRHELHIKEKLPIKPGGGESETAKHCQWHAVCNRSRSHCSCAMLMNAAWQCYTAWQCSGDLNHVHKVGFIKSCIYLSFSKDVILPIYWLIITACCKWTPDHYTHMYSFSKQLKDTIVQNVFVGCIVVYTLLKLNLFQCDNAPVHKVS